MDIIRFLDKNYLASIPLAKAKCRLTLTPELFFNTNTRNTLPLTGCTSRWLSHPRSYIQPFMGKLTNLQKFLAS